MDGMCVCRGVFTSEMAEVGESGDCDLQGSRGREKFRRARTPSQSRMTESKMRVSN
jgi:hypothetical protein